MGNKKRFNWKARKVVETIIDNSKTKKIKLDSKNYQNEKYDECNTLVLPSNKRKTKIKKEKIVVTKILSKKHRKHLEKIVERKKKSENRSLLLESLKQVQISPEELKQLTSIKDVQTRGLKNLNKLNQNYNDSKNEEKIHFNENSNQNLKRKSDHLIEENCKKICIDNPNIVGDVENISDESSSEEDLNEKNDELEKINSLLKDKNDTNINNIENLKESNEIKNSFKLFEPKNKNSLINENIKVQTNKSVYVHVNRTKEIQESRLKLPILSEEQIIMETINENSITIIAGETGSGKTTQLPQFLYEAGYASEKMIGVTEPRRIAAISMSKRVAEEMNLIDSNQVSYLIRFEGNVSEDTKIKFMTDGVLLKELKSDFLLKNYSVIIIDEAHERSIYTDILLGFLSRIVRLREKKNNPLKLIIMSATLRLEDFVDNRRLFKIPPPTIKIDSRQFPVTVHFNKRTPDDYLKEAFRKTTKIHSQLPEGGILIFLTGQREVKMLVNKLKKVFPLNEKYQQNFDTKKKKNKKIVLPEINLDDYNLPESLGEIVSEDENEESENNLDDDFNVEDQLIGRTNQPLWTLPMYALLSSQKQARVFQPPPKGCRLCVVSTNVTETSLTIPGIKYVIDCGKSKARLYDKITGISSYQITWISKASADQRAGRAGRVSPGHCYRLYSSAVYNDLFSKYSTPEIQQKPIDYLYLQMKCMNIEKIMNFPFPTSPDLLQIKAAEKQLVYLGALEENMDSVANKNSLKVTSLGQTLSKYPVLPRYAKMLALSHQHNLLQYVICIVSALSVQEVLIETLDNDEKSAENLKKFSQIRRQWAGEGHSLLLGDIMVLLKAVGSAEYYGSTTNKSLEKFCYKNGLRYKAIIEIRKLRLQLTNELTANIPSLNITVDPKMPPPSEKEIKLLRQIMLIGLCDRVAKKIDVENLKDGMDKQKFKHAYQCIDIDDPVFIHSKSVLRKKLPEWVIYQEIFETDKLYMRGITAIEPEWLPIYAKPLCNIIEFLKDPEPHYDPISDKIFCTVSATFGQKGWALPNAEIPFPDNSIDKYKWFCKFLLEGKIFEKLAKYSKSLLSSPNTMIKSWAKLHPRTEILLKAVASKQINSKRKLKEIWNDEHKFLLSEYCNWLPQSAQNEITLLWPPN